MKTNLILQRINVFKSWEPDSEPISMIYRPENSFNELANEIIKNLNLQDTNPQNLVISSSNPLISKLDADKSLKDQGITGSSLLYVKIKETNENSSVKPLKPQRPAHCTLLTKCIEKDGNDLAPAGYDITQKIIILYGIAANLYHYHTDEDEVDKEKVNFTPNYVFVDDEFKPYIDFDKLKVDSQGKDINDFLIFNAKYKPYLAPEVINNKKQEDDEESDEKADVYTFGSICFSMMSKTILTDEVKPDSSNIPPKLKNLIESCRNENTSKRPSFCDILFIITSQPFINDLQQFDAERFKKYQKTVVGKEFITEIDSHLDITKIPGVKVYQRTDFDKQKKIGKGMSGMVYIAIDKSNDQRVAFKELNKNDSDDPKDIYNEQMRTYREIEILASTNHYAIQKLYGYIEADEENQTTPVIMTPYEENGSLDKVIKKNPPNLDFTQKYIIMYGIAAGMYYLHKRNIIHRDIKPENILINDSLEPQITDFGLSKKSQEDSMFQSIVITGTPVYMAPELLEADQENFFSLYDARLADVYAFGLVLVFLFTGVRPWSNVKASMTLITKILAGERPQISPNVPEMLRLLIQACWDQTPSERPSFENILHIIGNQNFLENMGDQLNLEKFKEYQKKVVLDDSFLSDNPLNTHASNTKSHQDKILINGVKFPKIPEDKVCSILDFKISSEYDENENPFFIIREAELNSQPGSLYNIIRIKDEYVEDTDILTCFASQIQMLLSVDHLAINTLFACTDIPSHKKSDAHGESIYDYFPKEVRGPPGLIIPSSKIGNLSTYKHSLSITDKFIILYGIAAGMYYMHSKDMVHLNLKPENIILNDKCEPAINLDITSRSITSNHNLYYLLPIFSYAYVAPELLNFNEGKSKDENAKMSDVYSFAMVAYNLMTGIQPWNTNRGLQSILMRTIRGERPMTLGIVPYPFDKLIADCWETNPLKRPTFKLILDRMGSSNFVRSIDHVDVEQFQNYQKTVVDKEFITPIQLCAIRMRDEFEIAKMIGSGMFGNVRLAIDKLNGNQVAYKEIPSSQKDFIEREKQILSSMNYPSIISLYGLIEPDEEKEESVVLLPYAPNGDLDKMLQKEGKKKNGAPKGWDYTQRCIVLYGIAMGMFKLHEHEIIHRDLKPQNILLDNDLEPWITDFELSKFVDPNQSLFQSMTVGTPYYMSPESLNESNEVEGDDDEEEDEDKPKKKAHNYDGKLSDVYSFGMLVFYLMTGMQPWANIKSQFVLMQKVIDGVRPTIPDTLEKPVVDLITNCWQNAPESRPNFKQIVEIVSNPDFYMNPKQTFDRKRFYEYQLKLGDVDLIKFSDEEIKQFQESGGYTSTDDYKRKSDVLNIAQLLLDMANKGVPESQYRYGCMLKEGVEIPQDLEGAAKYFKLASDQGYLDGVIAYATCLKDGSGVEKNEKEAIELLKTAVDKDYTDALIALANWYCEIRPRKYGLAYELYKRADKKGHPDAPAYIGALIEKRKLGSVLTKKDVIKYYKKSCDLGSSIGMYHMATFYHYGIGVDKNLKEAIRLYSLASQIPDQNQAPAIFSLTVLYEEKGENETAFSTADFYREKDMFVGYVRCSDFYLRGIGVKKDEKKSKEYMDLACKERFANEQLTLALLYSRAKGVSQDKDQTFKWTEISAKNGNSAAQANLASYYIDGTGCEQDYNKAEEWAQKSSDAGNGHGCWALARVYRRKKEERKAKLYPKTEDKPEEKDKKKKKKKKEEDEEIKEYDRKELEYLQKSAQIGYEKAFVDLGKKYKDMKNKKDAIENFKEAADNRVPLGLYYYGKELMKGGDFVPEKDIEGGLKMMEDAAEMGCKEATQKLISIYSKGPDGVEKDEEKVRKYTEKLGKLDKTKSRRKSTF